MFLRPYAPRLRMVIIGAVHITAALVSMAQVADYEVVLIDPRRGFARPERWPGIRVFVDYPDDVFEELPLDARTAVVALTHDPKIDDPGLSVALRSPCFYIGALGSRRTHAARLERLGQQGLSDDLLSRIHGPVGLDIRAATPAEIAVAILAEVTGALRGAP
jgi:xanthine dehydrogenase accessory factor